MLTDLLFFTGMNSAVRLHSKRGATVYYYCFDYRGSNSFISLFMNATVDTGECLWFVEHVKYLQWAVREGYILFHFRTQDWASAHLHMHTHTISQYRWNVTMLILICTWHHRRFGSLVQEMVMLWNTMALAAERRSAMFITRTAKTPSMNTRSSFPWINAAGA